MGSDAIFCGIAEGKLFDVAFGIIKKKFKEEKSLNGVLFAKIKINKLMSKKIKLLMFLTKTGKWIKWGWWIWLPG